MTKVCRIVVGLLVSLASWAGVTVAQEPAAIGFACEKRAELQVPPQLKLTRHRPDAEQRRRLRVARSWSFGPFDVDTYGFEHVRFYRDALSDGGEFVQLLLHLDGPRPVWLTLPGEGSEWWGRYSRDSSRFLSVRLATPQAGLPLFVVASHDDDGKSAVVTELLLDLRPGRRRVPAQLNCIELLNQGPCGTWDGRYAQESVALGCPWDMQAQDFRCGELSDVTTSWGSRRAQRDYWLLSPELESATTIRAAKALEDFAAEAFRNPTAHREAEALGPVHVVATLGREAGGEIVVLGAVYPSSRFGMRFFLAERPPGGPVRVRPINEVDPTPGFWLSDRRDGTEVMMQGTPIPGPLSLRSTPLPLPTSGPSILQVFVHEDTGAKDSEDRLPPDPEAVYWLGLEQRDGETIASALRLATNSAVYAGCMRAKTTPNAVRITVSSPSPFVAELEMEPPHEVDLFNGDFMPPEGPDPRFPPGCPELLRVAWNDGFVVTTPTEPSTCPADREPRFVRFGDDGTIVPVGPPMPPKAQPE